MKFRFGFLALSSHIDGNGDKSGYLHAVNIRQTENRTDRNITSASNFKH